MNGIFVKKGETRGTTAQRFEVTGTHQKMGVPWVNYKPLNKMGEDGLYRHGSGQTYSCPRSEFVACTQRA